jgi:hypothetical protein
VINILLLTDEELNTCYIPVQGCKETASIKVNEQKIEVEKWKLQIQRTEFKLWNRKS